MLSRISSALSVLASCLLFACGGGGGDDEGEAGSLSDEAVASFAGTYQIVEYAENEDGCDNPTSALDTLGQSFVEGYEMNLFGTYLQFASCDDPVACAELASDAEDGTFAFSQLSYTLSEEIDADHLAGFTAWTGLALEAGVCSGRRYEVVDLIRASDGTVTITTETIALEDQPTDSEGYCVADPEEQKAEAEGRPCTSVEVLTLVPMP